MPPAKKGKYSLEFLNHSDQAKGMKLTLLLFSIAVAQIFFLFQWTFRNRIKPRSTECKLVCMYISFDHICEFHQCCSVWIELLKTWMMLNT